jgi:hypothetical protein
MAAHAERGKRSSAPAERSIQARMERRRATRDRQRLTCEVVHAGRTLRGVLIDASTSGAFVQVESRLPVGDEVVVRFADTSLAPQLARARIVRRRLASGAVASMFRSGVGLEWIEAPGFLSADWADRLEVVIESVGKADAVAAPAIACDPSAEPSAPAEPTAAEISPESPILPEPPSQRGEIALAEPAHREQLIDLAPHAVHADVALIDEGDLGGIAQLVQSLGASLLRLRWGSQVEPIAWAQPPRLVIVPARVALAVPLDEAVLARGAIGLAVSDSGAHTLHAQLRRQGYELVLRRSAHPETQRLLLASLLYRQRERRKHVRRAFGAPARVWHGIRPVRAVVLELSATGARIQLARPLAPGARIAVHVPRKHTGDRALVLVGAIERIEANAESVAGVRWEAMSARKRKRLEALLALLAASGPLAEADPIATRLGAAAPWKERRRSPRVRYAQQALKLDEKTGVARDVLFGTELSLRGMRIEPHPRMRVGAKLRLALQPPGAPPALLDAEVARDDGPRGLILRFSEATLSAREAIERMLAAGAEIERIGREQGDSGRVVLSTLVEATRSA